MTIASSRETYHHGDARNALLRSAGVLLERTGAANLSLRQLAEHAGLSRQAPYNHFADKQDLLAELVRAGFGRLTCETTVEDGIDAPPVERLARSARAYIAFAQGAPALFRLMFSRELVDVARYPATQAACVASLQVLERIVATLARPDAVGDLTLAAWSLVHGYATLCIETGVEDADRRDERAMLFARMIAAAAA